MVARFGGAAAMLLGMLAQLWRPLPMVVLGSATALAGIVAVILPESTGRDTIESSIKERARSVTECNAISDSR